jgi:hypothetical protein
MVRLFAPISLVVALFAMACTSTSPTSGSAAPAATSAPPAAQPAAQAPAQSTAAGWTRPMDVTPLTDLRTAASSVGGKAASGAGAFQIISQMPWPGDKVRVFFFGVQG